MSKAQGKFDFSVHHPFKQQSIHKQDVYLVFNRPNWPLAIKNAITATI